MFLGTYKQKLDSKGRMVVPSKYRDEIGESNLVVVPWWEGNLTVFTTEGFEEYMQTLNELQGSAADKRQIKRFIAANADMCRPDAQGRILLNQKLRAYAHLDGEVVITGDMISELGNAQPFYALLDQLRAIRPEAPVYFIGGDSDPPVTSREYFTGGSPFAPWVLGAQQRGAQLLSAPVSITRDDHTLWLTTGSLLNLDLDTMQGQYELQYLSALSSNDENAVELAAFNLSWLEQTRAARRAMTTQDAVVALMHAPPTQDDLREQIDLILCGHSLGGLMRLPFVGPVFIPSSSLPRYGLFPGPRTEAGLSRQGRTQVYVNSGLGSRASEYPSFFFRLFNPPSVTLVTLTPSSI